MATVRKFKAHPQSAPGDFYVVNGECISCGAPHAVAPDLIGWATESEYKHCIWKKQPQSDAELEQAFAAFEASEVGCYRYAGANPSIMNRIGTEYCDQKPLMSTEPHHPPSAEFHLTMIQDSHTHIRRILVSLLWSAVFAFLIWLLATYR